MDDDNDNDLHDLCDLNDLDGNDEDDDDDDDDIDHDDDDDDDDEYVVTIWHDIISKMNVTPNVVYLNWVPHHHSRLAVIIMITTKIFIILNISPMKWMIATIMI